MESMLSDSGFKPAMISTLHSWATSSLLSNDMFRFPWSCGWHAGSFSLNGWTLDEDWTLGPRNLRWGSRDWSQFSLSHGSWKGGCTIFLETISMSNFNFLKIKVFDHKTMFVLYMSEKAMCSLELLLFAFFKYNYGVLIKRVMVWMGG